MGYHREMAELCKPVAPELLFLRGLGWRRVLLWRLLAL